MPKMETLILNELTGLLRSFEGIEVEVVAEKEEEEEYKPKTDERGLLTEVDDLRALVQVLHGEMLEFLSHLDDPSFLLKMHAFSLLGLLDTAHNLVCDCHKREAKEEEKTI